MTNVIFDVIVIGGGHAGTEAAAAAARMGAKTALITQNLTTIGAMSCNPAIGGLGKGHLVREIDAMDGLMGRAADKAAIQYRVLNRKKGPAVQGPRVQVDRKRYRTAVQSFLKEYKHLTLIEDECVRLILSDQKVTGVAGRNAEYKCSALVLTAGTFLNGRIHIGAQQLEGGRMGERATSGVSRQLKALNFQVDRLKTGTPPRLNGRTIEFEKLYPQWGDETPQFMSSLTTAISASQVPCFITRTTPETHTRIRESLHRSALHVGAIRGAGPRYCPSIEDKIVRFADRTSHQIFLEPEGSDDSFIYPNGISTSLPQEVQKALVASIPGLEQARIVQDGYAIEYDFINPQELTSTLMTRRVRGLFFAGQINGTTGYEEAAAQGLAAGIGAAMYLQRSSATIFNRTNSYIGVMIDDLTLKGVSEPYRMFTSRAEYRLSLRADNADERLTSTGIDIGVVGSERRVHFTLLQEKIKNCREMLMNTYLTSGKVRATGCDVTEEERTRSVQEWAKLTNVNLHALINLCPAIQAISPVLISRLDADAKYSVYLDRQARDIDRQRIDEALFLPTGLDYDSLPGLSNEIKAKLSAFGPTTLGQASRMEGMTPAALMLLAAHVRRADRTASKEAHHSLRG